MTRVAGLGAEAVRSARAHLVTTTIVATVVVSVVAGILATTGQTVVAERRVLAAFDDIETRTVTISASPGAPGFPAESVDRIEGLGRVAWAVGTGAPRDVRPAGVTWAPPAAVWPLYGSFEQVLQMHGALPDGGVLLGRGALDRLPLSGPYGELVDEDGRGWGIHGWFEASPPLRTLAAADVVRSRSNEPRPVRVLTILARTADDVGAVAAAATELADPLGAYTVSTADALIDVRRVVSGQLGRFSRDVVVLVLAVGLLMSAIATFGAVALRRQDFGRRRALGARRADIVILILLQTSVGALIGAVVGCGLGLVIVRGVAGALPTMSFVLAVAVLGTLATLAAALPPAVLAAFREPVSVLRTP